MSELDRDDEIKKIVGKVSERIREFAPEGLGKWDMTWVLTNKSSNDLMSAIYDYMGDDTPETRQRVTDAANAHVEAWRNAAHEYYQREGV